MIQSMKRSTFTVLFITVFLDFLGFALILPYLFFYAESFGASPVVYGLVLGSYSLAQFVMTPVWGSLSDKFGRRKIILVCLFGSGLSFILLGLANNLLLLFFARIMAGAMAATFPVAGAYIADMTSPEIRFKYIAKIGAAFGLGMILGPAIGGTLSGLYGYAVPSLVAAAIAFSNLTLGLFRLPESLETKVKKNEKDSMMDMLRSIATRTDMKLLLAAYFIAMLGFFVMDGTAVPWMQQIFGFGPFNSGLLFFYIGIVIVTVQGLVIPRLAKKYSAHLILIIGISTMTIGLAILGAINVYNLLGLVISSTLIPMGMGFTMASTNTLVSLRAASNQQGGTLGITYSVSGIAQIIGPAFGASAFGYGVSIGLIGLPFIISAAILIPAIIISMALRKSISSQTGFDTAHPTTSDEA